ncbi:MAG: DEAD/DEAH box helicase [Thermoplasmata archaeon]|nr:DEAD/DEAH box helicase [Thermoplasmata archaeon]
MEPTKLVVQGLDPRIPPLIRGWGIEELYPPQAEAIPFVLEGKNVVVAVPTASGKSLVAYIGLVQGALKGNKGLYIVPLKALAQEKYEELQSFEVLGLKVGMSVGDLDRIEEGFDAYDILVTTSEKADSLLRHRERWGSSLSVVVADEVHLIHDDHRGPTMEVLLARLRQLNPLVQIIALSATIRNAYEISGWLDAKLVESDWRPVELREGVYFQHKIIFPNGTEKKVPGEEHIPSLAKQIIDEGGQCLVFVGTRRSAEATAKNLAGTLGLGKGVRAEVAEEEEVGLHKKLRWCLERGVAFHHAGLDSRYRRIVETSFKAGDIKCISATPTLAAGINLPARRVIMRDLKRYDPMTGSSYLPVLYVKQACGRAGRPHLDPYGEAILMGRSEAEAEHLIELYILGESEDIISKLGREPVLRRHLLGLVASGACPSRNAIDDFISTTFYAHQREVWEMEEEMEKALDYLLDRGFIEEDGGEEEEVAGRLWATLFGKRTSDLYIDPITACNYREAMESGKEPAAMGILHALASSPDMIQLYITKKDLESLEERVALCEEELLLPVPEDPASYDQFLREFKTASLLHDWIEEMGEEELSKRYAVGPGDIRNRVETARWLLHAMEAMAGLFNHSVSSPIRAVARRMGYGVKEELLDLVRIRNVGRKRARTLWKAGYTTASSVKDAGPKEIAILPGFGIRIAEKITGKKMDGKETTEESHEKGQQRLTDF